MSETHQKILRALEHAPAGMTDADLSAVLGIPLNTVRPRRLELLKRGAIRALNPGQPPLRWGLCFGELVPDAARVGRQTLRKACEPFAAQAAEMLESPILKRNDSTLFLLPFRATPAQLRALVAAWSPEDG